MSNLTLLVFLQLAGDPLDFSCYKNECVLAVEQTTADGFNTFYLLDTSGNLPAQPVSTASNDRIGYLRSTLSSIFYTKRVIIDSQSYEGLYRVSKNGGEETLIDYGSRTYIQYVNSSIYYNREIYQQTPGVYGYVALIVDSSGRTIAEYPNSKWMGGMGSTHEIHGGNKKILLAKNYTMAESGLAGATLEVFNTDTNQKIHELGVVPDDVNRLILGNPGDSYLVTAYIDRGLQSPELNDTDIFYYDINIPGSFTRITNTPDISESAVR